MQIDKKLAARAAGERFFDSEKPCKRGHISKRYASTGACVECLTGRSAAPLNAGQATVSARYTFNSVVPIESTKADLIALEPYLTRCLFEFFRSRGIAFPPYDMNRVLWSEQNGRPIADCPY